MNIYKNTFTAKKPNGQLFSVTNAWDENAGHQWTTITHHAFDGVGEITTFCNYGGSGNAFHELKTLGYITDETRRMIFN